VAAHAAEQRRARAGPEAVVLQVESAQPGLAQGAAQRHAARVADAIAAEQQRLQRLSRVRVRVSRVRVASPRLGLGVASPSPNPNPNPNPTNPNPNPNPTCSAVACGRQAARAAAPPSPTPLPLRSSVVSRAPSLSAAAGEGWG
jgi:hypothetical protein